MMVASVPLDTQVHDTYFVVAHFHYVLIGGAVFPLLGAIYYWFPKITGRMMSERLGRWVVRAGLRRLQPDVLPDAHPRPAGHAAPHLHLSARNGLGRPQPVRQPQRADPGRRASCCSSSTPSAAPRSGAPAGDNPWDAADAGMGDDVRRRRATTSPTSRSSAAPIRCGTSATTLPVADRPARRPARTAGQHRRAKPRPQAREVVAAEFDLAALDRDRHDASC